MLATSFELSCAASLGFYVLLSTLRIRFNTRTRSWLAVRMHVNLLVNLIFRSLELGCVVFLRYGQTEEILCLKDTFISNNTLHYSLIKASQFIQVFCY